METTPPKETYGYRVRHIKTKEWLNDKLYAQKRHATLARNYWSKPYTRKGFPLQYEIVKFKLIEVDLE